MTYPWNAGEVLSASDLNAEFASKLPYSYGTATPTTSDDGFLWYDENDTPPTPKFWDGAAFQALTSGKILQVVRATDTTTRTTNSTTLTDVTGVSVTISPQKSDSAIFVIVVGGLGIDYGTATVASYAITDSSNNILSGGGNIDLNLGAIPNARIPFVFWGYSTPATTSATTYKLRFKVQNASNTARVQGAVVTTQIYAIEVAA